MDELDRLLDGLSTYQDVVVAGETVRRGARDCETRWNAITPHLPKSGVLLDVGANFAWFCLKWCETGDDRLAVAVEADLRSAAVARHVLASHDHRRIMLCTALANAEAVRRWARAGQRFDAVFCLSVLHWVPDHREFLADLGAIADRIFVEQPSPHETGAGVAAIRESIGAVGPYLCGLFGDRPVERLATWAAHRTDEWPRELWMVGSRTNAPSSRRPTIDVAAALDLDAAWPPQSWWLEQLTKSGESERTTARWTPAGVEFAPAANGGRSKAAWRRAFAAVPQSGVTTLARRLRRTLGALRRRWKRATTAAVGA